MFQILLCVVVVAIAICVPLGQFAWCCRLIGRLHCPDCGTSYGFRSVWRSTKPIFSVTWEPGYWPRWGERPENVRGVTCPNCKKYAVFNAYGERYDELES